MFMLDKNSNGFNIDGASDTDPSTYSPSINEGGNSATAATRWPLDAIQEVSVVSAGGADSGQNSGGSVMNVIVRSGTNQFHGSAYEVHRDAVLDAKLFRNIGHEGAVRVERIWGDGRRPDHQESDLSSRGMTAAVYG